MRSCWTTIPAGVKFSGKWFNSRSPIFFGRAGAVPYRFALLDKTESATAAYTPRIPAAGFYPVYTWVRHGPDRTSQLYRILHTGGQTLVRVPHHMVGSGWVYLGTYYFEAGSDRKRGSVIVSNLQPSPGFGAVAVADAIRFGNGMGDVVPVPGGHDLDLSARGGSLVVLGAQEPRAGTDQRPVGALR